MAIERKLWKRKGVFILVWMRKRNVWPETKHFVIINIMQKMLGIYILSCVRLTCIYRRVENLKLFYKKNWHNMNCMWVKVQQSETLSKSFRPPRIFLLPFFCSYLYTKKTIVQEYRMNCVTPQSVGQIFWHSSKSNKLLNFMFN